MEALDSAAMFLRDRVCSKVYFRGGTIRTQTLFGVRNMQPYVHVHINVTVEAKIRQSWIILVLIDLFRECDRQHRDDFQEGGCKSRCAFALRRPGHK